MKWNWGNPKKHTVCIEHAKKLTRSKTEECTANYRAYTVCLLVCLRRGSPLWIRKGPRWRNGLGSLYEIPAFHPSGRTGIHPSLSKTEGHTCHCSRLKSPYWLAMKYQPAQVRTSSSAGTVYILYKSTVCFNGLLRWSIIWDLYCIIQFPSQQAFPVLHDSPLS